MSAWERRRLAELTTKIGSGATPRGGKGVYQDEGTSFIRSQNVYDLRFDHDGLAHISDQAADALKGVTVNSADVLVNITGESVARTCLVDDAALPARVSQHVAIVRAEPTQLAPGFLLYALLNPPTKARLNTLSQAGATRRALTKGHLERLEVAVPPLEEQERIAGVLGAFDDLIETNRGLIADLENLIHALFVEEQFDALPSPASAVSLGDLLIVNPKIAKPKGSAPYIDMAMLPTSSALLGSPLERTASGGAKFANGDTLLARITPCLENGKTAYVTNLPEGSVAVGSTEFIVMRGVGDLSGIWSYALARSPRFRGFAIQQLGDGTSGRQRLSADAVSGYLVTRPSTQALTRFRQRTEPLVEAMTALHSEGLDLSEKRDELLPLLMSGKVRVRDVESELS